MEGDAAATRSCERDAAELGPSLHAVVKIAMQAGPPSVDWGGVGSWW